MIYNKIRGAKSSLDNYNNREEHVPKEDVRKLKLLQIEEERKYVIDKENKRLLDKMASIVSGTKSSTSDARAMFHSSKLLPGR